LLFEGETRDGAGCISTQAGQRSQVRERLREHTVEALLSHSGGEVKVSRSAVVAQWGPHPQDFTERCISQGANRWKSLEKLLVLRQYAVNLRLLQHDLRNEHSVRITRLPPG